MLSITFTGEDHAELVAQMRDYLGRDAVVETGHLPADETRARTLREQMRQVIERVHNDVARGLLRMVAAAVADNRRVGFAEALAAAGLKSNEGRIWAGKVGAINRGALNVLGRNVLEWDAVAKSYTMTRDDANAVLTVLATYGSPTAPEVHGGGENPEES